MEMLGRYTVTVPLSNKNAGSCKWCFGTYNGREYFIKEFLEPKHPENDTVSSPEKIQRKLRKCQKFENNKKEIYATINQYSDGNAVRVEEFFRIGAKYYMAMPRITGLKLEPEDVAKLPEHVRRRLCTIIAHAMKQIHRGKYVHADIKHTNIMICKTASGSLTAKVIDYDAGYFEHSPPTHPEEIGGDQVYFSPEAWLAMLGEEAALTCKLDVFALGILFHQYLTGHLPAYDQEKYSCAGEAVSQGQTLEVSWDMPADLHRILCKMLVADPEKRATAEEVYEAFSRPMKAGVPAAEETPAGKPETPVNNFEGDAPTAVGFWDLGDLS